MKMETLKRYRSVLFFAIFLLVGVFYLVNYIATDKAMKTERISREKGVQDFWRYDAATHRYVSR